MNAVQLPLLRVLLLRSGYQVAERTVGWSECFVHRGSERLVGRGESPAHAFLDVVEQLFPSHITRELLEQHLRRAATEPLSPPMLDSDASLLAVSHSDGPPVDVPPAAAPVAKPTVPASPASLVETTAAASRHETFRVESPSEVNVGATAPHLLTLSGETSSGARMAPPPAVATFVEAAASLSEPELPAPAERSASLPGANDKPRPRTAEPSEEKSPRLRATEAFESVEKLLASIEDHLGTLARMSADRQRLRMLVWICRARAVEESLPGVREVEHAVARVARRLTDIGKMFWPGSVRALQLSARPADVRREMHATWAAEPSNWHEATVLAERLLDDHLNRSNEASLDEDGWADGAQRIPRPTDPDAMFEEVDHELKTLLTSPGEVPNSRLADLSATDLDTLINAARRLRWLRGAVKDDLAWGVAMGRLRRSVPGLADRAQRVRDVLDHRSKPLVPWAKVLGEREVEPAPTSATTESPDKLKADLDEAKQTKEGLLAWLIRAFDVLNTPDLVELLVPLKDEVASLGDDALNHSDRRIRRRLRELVRRVSSTEADVASGASLRDGASDLEEAGNHDDPMAAHALEALAAQVREQTKGNRALFVSNREDPELGARLEELLGITIAWCDGSLRRVQAACERIHRGTYDLVLSATGFQVHGVDSALARASGTASIPYIRVNRGRPIACIKAIAREFGLTQHTGQYSLPSAINDARPRG